MRVLTIEAASLHSARGFHAALSGFRPELEKDTHGQYSVRVSFDSDRDILRVLQTLETHVARRDEEGPD